MKTKRILITLSLGYGINMMGFESSLTREQISVSNPELTVLSLREFCMLSKENLLRMDDMTPDKVAAYREQIEISRYYERLPKPAIIATEEFLDDELFFKENKEVKEA